MEVRKSLIAANRWWHQPRSMSPAWCNAVHMARHLATGSDPSAFMFSLKNFNNIRKTARSPSVTTFLPLATNFVSPRNSLASDR